MKHILIFILFTQVFCVNLVAQKSEEVSVRAKNEFRFTLGGGYAYRLGILLKTGDDHIDELSQKLRHGFNLDASGQMYFTPHIGIGLNAIYVRQHEYDEGKTIPTMTGYATMDYFKETTEFFYIGPSFAIKTRANKINCYGEVGFGLLIFHDWGKVLETSGDIIRPTTGLHWSFSPEYRFSSHFGMGLKLSVTAGFVRVPFSETENKKQNASNLNIGWFISFQTK